MAVPLSFKSEGHGSSALIILHGLFGSGTNWRSVSRRLAGDYRVFSVDLRNHGDSPHTDTMSYPEMADDVRALMDDQGLDAAVVLGHSMGGKTAMRLALESPERVARLMVVDIVPTPSREDHGPVIDAMTALDLAAVGSRGDADSRLAAALPDPGLRQFLLQNLRSGPGGFSWRINLPAIRSSLPKLLDFPGGDAPWRYPGPTWVLRGEHSGYVLPEHQGAIHALFPRAQMVTIKGAGHWPHAEQPARFGEALARALA
jgi:esterase